jgi:hypothetical protein
VLPDLPPGFVADLFATEPEGTIVRADGDAAILARVVEVQPFDSASPENAALADNVQTQLSAQAADDALTLYVQALQNEAGVSVDQQLFEQLLAQFP